MTKEASNPRIQEAGTSKCLAFLVEKEIINRLVACYMCWISTTLLLYSPQEELVQLKEGTHRSEEPVSKRTLKT